MAALAALAAAAVGAGASIYQGYQQAEAAKAQATSAKASADVNAILTRSGEADAFARGEQDAAKIRRNAKRITGAQRAALAAQGLDPDAGSGLELQKDTAALAAADVLTVRNNAWREAFGYRAQEIDITARGRYAQISGNATARASLLTGGLQAAQYGFRGGYEYLKG